MGDPKSAPGGTLVPGSLGEPVDLDVPPPRSDADGSLRDRPAKRDRHWKGHGSSVTFQVVVAVVCAALMIVVAVSPQVQTLVAGRSRGSGGSSSSNSIPAESKASVGSDPNFEVVDAQNGWIYVDNEGASSVSIVNGSYGTTSVTSVGVGSDPTWATYDASNHDVYVSNYDSNTVSVISGTTVVATLAVGSQPLISAYDPLNGYVYVPNSGSSTVSVINGASNSIQGTVNVGPDPHSVTIDSVNGYAYVAEWGAGVSVVNGLTRLKEITVGSEPLNAAFDAGNGYVYVSNSASSNVSILSGTSVVASRVVGTGPNAMTYDPVTGLVYVGNSGSSNVSILSGTSLLASVTVGSDPLFSAYDPANGAIYVPISGGTSVAVVNGTTLEPSFAVGTDPHEAVYDPSIGQIVVTNAGSGNVSLIPVPCILTTEQDLPYNSINQTGGGVSVSWSYPALAWPSPVNAVFVKVYNATLSDSISLTPAQLGSSGWSGLVNLSLPLVSNGQYDFSVAVNDTSHNVSSAVGSFVYHRDTSKDGLTDAEKVAGWTVPLVSGPEKVTANVSRFSTNGLANDFLEDRYGLNPNTLDSAGGDMLDLWNLTFALGSNASNPGVPDSKDFHLWWETNTSYNPFKGAPFPNDPSWNGAPTATGSGGTGLSNISCTATSCPGNSSYSASVLWSRAALSTFLNMSGAVAATSSGEWLRGIVATYSGERTLTLWGKLSWGANPYAVSTPGDGIADGARVNPLYSVGLELRFYPPSTNSGWGMLIDPNATSGGCGNVPEGAGLAESIDIPDAVVSGHQGIQNYSAQSNPKTNTGTCSGMGLYNYALTTAVNNTLQTETITLGTVANISTNTKPDLESLPVNGCQDNVNISVDMLNPPPLASSSGEAKFMYWGNGNGACKQDGGAATFTQLTVAVVPVGVKGWTYLWLPDSNGTLTSAPIGLQQYVGDQSFVEVVVNNGATGTLFETSLYGGEATAPIPYPGHPTVTYSMSFHAGLTALLMPRGAFLSSDLGLALVRDSYLAYSASGTPPLLAPNDTYNDEGAPMQTFGASNLLESVACFWQNRSASSPGSAAICGSEKGVANGAVGAITVDAATSATSTNLGGLPSDPGFENASVAGAAIQGIVAINMTNWSDANLLVAALLDNSTGGVNGSFVNVTGELASLGLDAAVMSAIPNMTYPSGGLYGVPISSALPPPPPQSWWQAAWNAVSGVITVVIKSVTTVVGLVWSVTAAAINFIDYLGEGLAHLGAAIVQRTVSALTTVGSALERAFQELLTLLASTIVKLLSSAFAPIIQAVDSYMFGLASAIWAVANDTAAGRSPATDAARFWSVFDEPILMVALGLGVVLSVVLTLTEVFSFGTTFLIPLIIGALITGAAAAVAAAGGPSYMSDFAGISPFSASMANELDNLFGSTGPNGRPAMVADSVVVETSTPSLGYLFGGLATTLGAGTTGWALQTIVNSVSATPPKPVEWTDSVGFALGVLGILLGSAASYYNSVAGTIVSLSFDMGSLIVDAAAFEEPGAEADELENTVILLVDAGSTAMDLAAFAAGN